MLVLASEYAPLWSPREGGNILIIDGHAHACGEYHDLDSILGVLDSNHAAKVVLSPGEAGSKKTYGLPSLSERFPGQDFIFGVNAVIGFVTRISGAAAHIDQQNEYVNKLAKMCPERIIQAYWANPLEDSSVEKLESDYERFRFRMLKLHQCWNRFDLRSTHADAIMDWTLGHNMPIFIHISTKQQVQAFIATANAHLEQTFIVAHLIGFEDIHRSIRNENVYYEVSPPQLIPVNKLKSALDKVGAERLILGSDTPYGKGNLRKNIDRIDGLPISDREKELIMGANIYELLHGR